MIKEGWTSTVEDLNSLYDTLDLVTILSRSLNYLSTKVQCENIIWFLPEEVQGVLDSRDEYEPRPVLERKAYMCAQSNIKIKEAVRLVRYLGIDDDYICDKDAQPIIQQENESLHIFHPVKYEKDNKIIGYFLFANVLHEDKDSLLERGSELIRLMSRHLHFSVSHYRLKMQSYTDDLTDLFNQRYLPMVLDKEIERSDRKNRDFTLLFIDVDYFKIVNDTRGHLVGSEVLSAIGKVIKAHVRATDYAFRYGGDEFIVVLPATNVENSQKVAERIREGVEAAQFAPMAPDLKVTVSIGIASYPTIAKSSKQVLQMADEAMYHAKNKSRNITYVAAS